MAEYIEREKVYEMLNAIGGCGAEPESWADGWDKAIDTAIKELSDISAADVRAERYSHWHEYENSVFMGRCDKNGEPIFQDKKTFMCMKCGRNTVIKEKFCPSCGAKMDGGEL